MKGRNEANFQGDRLDRSVPKATATQYESHDIEMWLINVLSKQHTQFFQPLDQLMAKKNSIRKGHEAWHVFSRLGPLCRTAILEFLGFRNRNESTFRHWTLLYIKIPKEPWKNRLFGERREEQVVQVLIICRYLDQEKKITDGNDGIRPSESKFKKPLVALDTLLHNSALNTESSGIPLPPVSPPLPQPNRNQSAQSKPENDSLRASNANRPSEVDHSLYQRWPSSKMILSSQIGDHAGSDLVNLAKRGGTTPKDKNLRPSTEDYYSPSRYRSTPAYSSGIWQSTANRSDEDLRYAPIDVSFDPQYNRHSNPRQQDEKLRRILRDESRKRPKTRSKEKSRERLRERSIERLRPRLRERQMEESRWGSSKDDEIYGRRTEIPDEVTGIDEMGLRSRRMKEPEENILVRRVARENTDEKKERPMARSRPRVRWRTGSRERNCKLGSNK